MPSTVISSLQSNCPRPVEREKGMNLTDSYDNIPYTNEKNKKEK